MKLNPNSITDDELKFLFEILIDNDIDSEMWDLIIMVKRKAEHEYINKNNNIK
jgi:hypothetical protein